MLSTQMARHDPLPGGHLRDDAVSRAERFAHEIGTRRLEDFGRLPRISLLSDPRIGGYCSDPVTAHSVVREEVPGQ